MVERSSTSTVATYFGGYGSGPLDRTLGAAATLGLGVVLVQSVSRYLRRLNNNNEQSWIATLLSVMRNLMTRSNRSSIDDEEEPSAAIVTGTAVHSGTCHCRSVVFEFRGPAAIKPKDGQGKIHYPHVRVEASDFRFVAGGDMLKMYYVMVPASGSSAGVEPITAAFTFCSRCGVHVLHAPSAHSNMIDVNVDCLNTDKKWTLSEQKGNLSYGVPLPDQWKDNFDTINEADEYARGDFFTLGPMANSIVSDEDSRSMQESWSLPTPKELKMDSTVVSPGTPSTSSTSGTGSHLAARVRSFGMEDSRTGSEDSDHHIAAPPVLKLPPAANLNLRLPPPIETGLSLSPGSEISASNTTPMMRDQLKYYMSKHVSSSGKKHTPPLSAPTQRTTETGEINE